ncbi:MAG: D-tyrosyl-tRNA(Tyr) deacylase [Ktedonobacterales bacterium]|nr:D-tyrosyl-tRNA(Tyr) deacylase [Ktedonobacterales bacterium]
MRVVLQRVREANVTVDDATTGAIGPGLLLLAGIGPDDTTDTVRAMATRLVNIRVFEDDTGRMNRSAQEVGAELLVVSQVTLYAEIGKGRRPQFNHAAPPDRAAALITAFTAALRELGFTVAEGRFGAHMVVALVNDGPVTLVLEEPPPVV